jgi:hypothetical protein
VARAIRADERTLIRRTDQAITSHYAYSGGHVEENPATTFSSSPLLQTRCDFRGIRQSNGNRTSPS